MKHNWEYRPFDRVAHTITPVSKIEKSEYLTCGLVPIISQEETLISGYWDNSKDVTPHQKPVVIFGDHSRVLKYIDFEFVVGADGVKIIEPKEDISPKFLYYYLHWLNIPSLGYSRHFKLVKEALYVMPPMEVQEQIVAELDKINELIEQNRELLRHLDALAQSIFYDTFGDPITNPKGWKMVTIEDVCTLKSGDSSANKLPFGKTPYVKVGDMNLPENKTYIQTSSNFVNTEGKNKLLFPIGTTIFPKRGGAILTNKKRLTKTEICCDLNIMGAIPKNINSEYLFFYFILKDFSELVDGSTVPQINNGDIYPLKIQLPPLSLQNQFAAQVEAIEAQKAMVEKSIVELQTLLDSRMDYWFN